MEAPILRRKRREDGSLNSYDTKQPKNHPQSEGGFLIYNQLLNDQVAARCLLPESKTQIAPAAPPKRGDGRHTDGPEGVSALPPLFPRRLEKGTILQTGHVEGAFSVQAACASADCVDEGGETQCLLPP